eukprot:TRINITY_DN9687_c0_g1_i1.p1 TRINITY_DN9687_c0_g1~~TRINITY_DN9687_c0_g1_i1.p1  ORF type:complete len:215 (+),score=85.77 TRINITY_DN9687_c0_g1_i1:209-853(+)
MGTGHYCGACVAGTIKQQDGSTKDFKGVIDNACGTCGYNDLDFGIDGDGRYDITWDFISCPEHDLMLSVEVGNPYYGLISVQGGGPIDGVEINGAAAAQQDGLWAIHSDAGQLGCGPEVRVRLRDGRDVTRCMSPGDFGGDCLNDGPRCSGDRRRALWPTGGYHHETTAAAAAAAGRVLPLLFLRQPACLWRARGRRLRAVGNRELQLPLPALV